MSEKVLKAINQQINREIYSSYLYLAMAVHFGAENFPGAQHWMELQAQEEMDHAKRMLQYLNDRGFTPKMLPIEAPEYFGSTPLEVFEKTLEHEKKITKMINDLMALAYEEHDFASQEFLRWFVSEQVEEEASVDEVITQLTRIDNDKLALLYLDEKLAQRTNQLASDNGQQ